MNVKEFDRYFATHAREIKEELFRREDEEVNGNEEDYRLIGEDIERFPIYISRRRRGS